MCFEIIQNLYIKDKLSFILNLKQKKNYIIPNILNNLKFL